MSSYDGPVPISSEGLVLNLDFVNTKRYTSVGAGQSLVGKIKFTKLSNISYSSGYMSFPGTLNNAWIDTGTKLPSVLNDFTLDFYVRARSAQVTYADIFKNHGNGFRGIVIQQNIGTTNEYALVWGNGSSLVNSSNFNLAPNIWTHVVLIRNGSFVYNYLDSALQATASGVSTSQVLVHSSSNVMIGNGYDTGPRPFNGDISFFRVYNRALTQEEVGKSYDFVKRRYNLS